MFLSGGCRRLDVGRLEGFGDETVPAHDATFGNGRYEWGELSRVCNFPCVTFPVFMAFGAGRSATGKSYTRGLDDVDVHGLGSEGLDVGEKGLDEKGPGRFHLFQDLCMVRVSNRLMGMGDLLDFVYFPLCFRNGSSFKSGLLI